MPDLVLVMTVEPGFGGQAFMEDMIPKITALHTRYPSLPIQVDGGINAENVKRTRNAGSRIAVAGTSVFAAKDRKAAIDQLRM